MNHRLLARNDVEEVTNAPIPTIGERPACVAEFNAPAYW